MILHRRVNPTRIIVIGALLSLSAAPPASPDDFIRQGNQAAERGEFDEALRSYQLGEERGNDPGLIAFNKAVAYYHLHDYRQAESQLRMALDDAAIPAERSAKAWYNLGNCLVKQAGDQDVKLLREAIRCFEQSLDAAIDDGIRSNAAHNLELAKLLWIKARSRMAEQPPPNADEPPADQRQPKQKKDRVPKGDDADTGKPGKDGKSDTEPKHPKSPDGMTEGKEPTTKDRSPKPGPSRVPVIPDQDELEQRTPEETFQALQFADERLRKERERNRMDIAIPERPSGRDW